MLNGLIFGRTSKRDFAAEPSSGTEPFEHEHEDDLIVAPLGCQQKKDFSHLQHRIKL
jgi:hypothetical protein